MTESKKRQTIDEGWKQATEDINACDTTAYTEAYDLRVTCIPQQKPKNCVNIRRLVLLFAMDVWSCSSALITKRLMN